MKHEFALASPFELLVFVLANAAPNRLREIMYNSIGIDYSCFLVKLTIRLARETMKNARNANCTKLNVACIGMLSVRVMPM